MHKIVLNQFLPECLAVPWHGVCDRLGIYPSLTDYIAANCNWTRYDLDGDYELDNLKAICTLTVSRGYEWVRGTFLI